MIDRPIVILGAPRSGTTILQRCLALHPDLWHLRGESHRILEGPFHPIKHGLDSNRVTQDDFTNETIHALRAAFYNDAINLNRVMRNPERILTGNSIPKRVFNKMALRAANTLSNPENSIRFLEKTPKNSLRVPLMQALFPDAKFIWIQREPATNIDSLIAGWHATDNIGFVQRERFGRAGYAIMDQLAIQDYEGVRWKFALVPEWQSLRGKTIADVAAWQYVQCNRYIMEDAHTLYTIQYETFIQDPVAAIDAILEWADLPPDPLVTDFATRLPRVNDANPNRKAGLRYPDAVARVMDDHIANLYAQMTHA